MDPLDTKKRIFAAHKLLTEKTTSKEKIESVKSLIKGINPRIDKLLEDTVKAFSDLEKFYKGEVIELTVEHLPENTEEEQKRKKALLWFIRNWKSLHSEVDIVKKEFEKGNQTSEQKIQSAGRITTLAKGPFGLITAAAVIIVISLSVFSGKKISPTQVIIFSGKQIPLTELTTGQGQECMNGNIEAPHYHAKDHVMAKALDGLTVSDPGGCGFGKVKDVKIVEIE